MIKRLLTVAFLFLSLVAATQAQSAAKQTQESSKVKADYSAEAVYCDKIRMDVRFENDGTGAMHYSASCHVQSEAGVKAFGLLGFAYQRDLQDMEPGYVRVRKPDGSIVITPPENAQDMPADVTRVAPMYSGLRVRHITVTNLRPGDVIEWDYTIRTKTALIPGQFWFDSSFEKQLITLDEQVTLDVPAARKLTMIIAPGTETKSREENGRKIYSWAASNLEHKKVDNKKRPADSDEESAEPAVQVSTLQNWDELGLWFTEIQEDRVAPTAIIKAKAAELTRGSTSDSQKAEAIYAFVSREIRYVALEFGIGRFRANPAETVLANGYGDCKDKHTLLASLLRAVGIEAHPVLIHTSRKLNSKIASPSQVNHVITMVQLGSERIYLDTTPEVAPFGLIQPPLRGKEALLLLPDKKIEIVTTPADSPFPQTKTLDVVGSVDASGKIEAEITQTFRGDDELLLRSSFRQTPRDRWKDVAQTIAFLTGFGGQVSEVTTSDVEDFRVPLQIKYHYTRENYVTWTDEKGKMRLALPSFGLSDSRDADGKPVDVKFSTPVTLVYRAKIKLPPYSVATLPERIDENHSFADYASSYKMEGESLVAERTLKLKTMKLEEKDRDAYHDFYTEVSADNDDLEIASRAYVAARHNDKEPVLGVRTKEQREIALLYDAGMEAFRQRDKQTAIAKFQETVKLDPKHPDAWNQLGKLRMMSNDPDEAIRCLRKQLEVNPGHPDANVTLGSLLISQGHPREGIAALNKQLAAFPGDLYANGVLANYYWRKDDLKSALPYLETVVNAGGAEPQTKEGLGRAYLKTGQKDKALVVFNQLLESDPLPYIQNEVAYLMADDDLEVDRALEVARKSMDRTSKTLRDLNLDDVNEDVLSNVSLLVATWDTVGWAYAKKGEYEEARRYLAAAWASDQRAEVAKHLAFVLEKLGSAKAAEMKMFAASLENSSNSTTPKFSKMSPKEVQRYNASSLEHAKITDRIQKMRTIILKRKSAEAGSGEFLFLIGDNGVESVKFVEGNEEMRGWSDSLQKEQLPGILPDPGRAKLVRRGILNCDARCMVVLVPPESAVEK